MKVEDIEPEMEALFRRLIPDYMNWDGATEEEIKKIEKIVRKISGHDLPRFYRWFLMRMGHSMSDFGDDELDRSVSEIISWYDGNWLDDGTKFFKIGDGTDELELHMYYDFNHRARDDARVVKRHAEGGDVYNFGETFRELLASDAAQINAMSFPEYCSGALLDETSSDILPQLNPIMDSLGFERIPFPKGPRVEIYVSDKATMLFSTTLDTGTNAGAFTLGGVDRDCLCKILGTIAAETDFIFDVPDDPRNL